MLNDPRRTGTAVATVPPGVAAPGATPARRSRLRLALRIGLFVLLALVILVVAAVVLILSGPVELGFLRGQVDSAIERALGPGYEATVEGAALDIDPVLGLVLRLSDISVVAGGARPVARVPSALLVINPAGIFNSEAVIRAVEVDDLYVSVVRDGSLVALGRAAPVPAIVAGQPGPVDDIGRLIDGAGAPALPPVAAPVANPNPAAADAPPAGAFDSLAASVEALEQSLEEALRVATESGFESFAAYRATIEVWNAGSPEPQRFTRTDVRLDIDPDAREVTAVLTTSGYSGRWTATAERMVNPTTGSRSLSVVFSQLTLTDIFPTLGGGEAIITDIPLYGRISARFDPEGALESASARLDLGAGNLAFGREADPMLLDEATIRLSWDVANDMIAVGQSPFYFGPSQATFTGWIRPLGGRDSQRLAFDLVARDAVLAPRDSDAPPLAVDSIRFAGDIDLSRRLLTFDTAALSSREGSLVAAGSIGFEDAGASVALSASLTEMPITVLKQIWPVGLADGGRRWALRALRGGRVLDGSISVAIPAGTMKVGVPAVLTPDMLRVQVDLADTSFIAVDGFPEVTGANGVAVLSGSTFGVDLSSGTITTPLGQTVEITAAAFAIPDTSSGISLAQLEATGIGSASAFAELANLDPLNALETYGIQPGDVAGDGNARVSARWQLDEAVDFEGVDWQVTLNLSDFASTVPIEGRTITQGQLVLSIDPTMFSIAGRGLVDGTPADVDLAFPLLEGAGGRQQIRLVLDEESRSRLGFNLEGFLGGTVLASMSDSGDPARGQHYELDLRQARVMLTPLGWTKGIGVPATMAFDLVTTPDGFWVKDIVLTGDGFGFSGEAWMDANYGVLGARIEDFHLRRDDNISFTLTREGEGWRIDAEGEALDVRGVVAEIGSSFTGAAGGGTDLVIEGEVDRLIGFNGQTIEDASLSLVIDDGTMLHAEITGTLNGTPLTAVYGDPPNANAIINVTSTDGGALLAFVNLYTRAHGGTLSIVGRSAAPEAPLQGRLEMVNFSIVDEPALVRLMAPSTPAGQAPPTDLAVDTFDFDFTQRGSTIFVEEGLLRGGTAGATWAGSLDMALGQLNLTGTYIPAYELNNMFGRIPILGLALGGGQEGGLFGITFRVSGPLDSVQLEVNPLSAIAPGILRKIFEFAP
ncbi:MAG: hypothetical protein KIS96_01710 [Bauldia sp.]|nr:hypothetical protein [Bauldia sp.]